MNTTSSTVSVARSSRLFEKASPSQFSQLDANVLTSILSFLPVETLRVALFVNREWSAVISAEPLWESVCKHYSIRPTDAISSAGPRFRSFKDAVAAMASSTVFSWGVGESGQLGLSDRSAWCRPIPLHNPSLPRVRAVSCGSSHTLFLTFCGRVFFAGRCVTPAPERPIHDAPKELPFFRANPARDVMSGRRHCGVISRANCLFAWGHNYKGQLADAAAPSADAPTLLARGVAAASFGAHASAWLLSSGAAFHVGNGAPIPRTLPLPSVSAIFAADVTYAISGGGLHSVSFGDPPVVVAYAAPRDVVAVAARAGHAVALLSDGTLWRAARGTTQLFALDDTPPLVRFAAVRAGSGHFAALSDDGRV